MSKQAQPASHSHAVPLWGLFLALLALTAAEVALFEVWHRTAVEAADGTMTYFIPKLAMVLLLFVFTIPKAVIVMVYFMHLKFEKQLIICSAILPFPLVGVAILPTLSDIVTLKSQATNKVVGLGQWVPPYASGHGEEHLAPAGEVDDQATLEDAAADHDHAEGDEAGHEH